MNEKDILKAAERIRSGKKYRGLDLPIETIITLIEQESTRFKTDAQVLQSVKRKLHNIVGLYLDDLDYAEWMEIISSLPDEPLQEDIQSICLDVMSHHESTKERLRYLDAFYQSILCVCPEPNCVLDLACGLNPFSLPFMNLPPETAYHAYDIHAPRVALINQFFKIMNRPELAEVRDILIHPPQTRADAVFLFKEAHRIEKRKAGANRELVNAVNARFIFLSLPNHCLNGKYDLHKRMRMLASSIFKGETVEEIEFSAETIYWVERKNA